MVHVRLLSLTFFICVSGHCSFAQEKDAGLWTSISVEKKFTQKFSANISEELRFNQNISILGSFFTDAGITFRLNDAFRIAANYRFINRHRLDGSYSKRHRYYFDLSWRKKINRITPVARLRFQSQYTDMYSSPDGFIPEYYLRPKFSLRYNMKGKWNPYIGCELFYGIPKELDNARYTLGAERSINKKVSLDIFFLHQREFNVRNPIYDYIWGFTISYSI